jgi:uncharacterized membrane protein YphA (DoxX/SURF4 family)
MKGHGKFLRRNGIGIVRIGYGLVWLADAWLKWQPEFLNGLLGYLTGASQGQPAAVRAWTGLWIDLVRPDPILFAYLVAAVETFVAIGLILGAFSNLVDLAGALLSLVIWSTAEAFGRFYAPGAMDIGDEIVYALLFAALFAARAGWSLGVDRRLTPALGRWGFLASGPLPGER